MSKTALRSEKTRTGDLGELLAQEEDKLLTCVHCGFCLPVCPTYTRLGDEADSPRGRLHLMRAVVEDRLDAAEPAFGTHIDRCLGCRACETVCPSGVEYGSLLERARALIVEKVGSSRAARLLLTVFGNRAATRVVMAGARLLRATGLTRLLIRVLPARLRRARFGLAMLAATAPARLDAVVGRRAAERAGEGEPNGEGVKDAVELEGVAGSAHAESSHRATQASNAARATKAAEARAADAPTVALLSGCVQDGLFGRVNRATARVLRANGCRIVAAPAQRCCGALHAHDGDLARAKELARKNIDAFDDAGADRVIVNSAGCGAAMKEYGELLADDAAFADRARRLEHRVLDVSELLVELGPAPGAPLPLRVTYDAPCHLHHAQRITREPLDVLRSIPALERVPLPRADECCGGAGIYGLLHPDLGGRILEDKVAAVRSTGADIVVTPNPGCMMQIGAGLLLDGADLPVLHPLELLDASYRRAGRYDADG